MTFNLLPARIQDVFQISPCLVRWVYNWLLAYHQGCYRVLVSLFSWPGQLLVLESLPEAKILARMLFLRILSLTVVITDIAAYLIKDCD